MLKIKEKNVKLLGAKYHLYDASPADGSLYKSMDFLLIRYAVNALTSDQGDQYADSKTLSEKLLDQMDWNLTDQPADFNNPANSLTYVTLREMARYQNDQIDELDEYLYDRDLRALLDDPQALEKGQELGPFASLVAVSEHFGIAFRVWQKKGFVSKSWKKILEYEPHENLKAPFAAAKWEGCFRHIQFDFGLVSGKLENKPLFGPFFIDRPIVSKPKLPAVQPIDNLFVDETELDEYMFNPEVRELARGHVESQDVNTLDTPMRLPLIDAHCHLGGLGWSRKVKKILRAPGIKSTGASMGYYMLSHDDEIAKKLINSMLHFCRDIHRPQDVATITLTLDMAYCPLDIQEKTDSVENILDFIKMILPTTGGLSKLKKIGISLLIHTEQSRVDKYGDKNLYYTLPADKNPPKYYWLDRSKKFWVNAIDEINVAVKKYPGLIWPLIGFDPRREKDALEVIKESLPAKGFVGIKLYTRTGWMPIHNQIIYEKNPGNQIDDRIVEFFDWALQEDVPITVHCSPTGFPPDGVLSLPWTFTGLRVTSGAYQIDKKPYLDGFAPIKKPLWPPPYERSELTNKKEREDPIKAIRGHACALANYCLYNQWTTSPYAWEIVLDNDKYKNLRLDLAHFGADLGAYTTPMRDMPDFHDWETGLIKHPYVAPAQGPRNFREYFKLEVIRRAKEEYSRFYSSKKLGIHSTTGFGEKIAKEIYDRDFFEKDQKWAKWLEEWELSYPYSWEEKIIKMIASDKYPNLYTDIAYITVKADMFGPAFGPIIKQALTDSPEGQGLKKRLMVGTDWFMTEMQSCSPRDFWKLVHNTFEKYVSSKSVVGHHNKEILRELWTTLNALRFINLVGGKKSRLETLEKEVYASGVLPPWWKALKHHYEKGYHKDEHIKKFIKDISELEPSPEQKPDTTMTSDDYDDYVLEKGPFERPDSAAAGWPDVPP